MSISPKTRCKWVGANQKAMDYHDKIWGKKPKDDRGYFQALSIEVLEAGLNFKLILNKLEHFQKQYHNFEPAKTAKMKESDILKILEDTEGLRSRKKAEAIIHNAIIVLDIVKEYGSFGKWITSVAKKNKGEVEKIFKEKFKFVGPTIVFEFLTSTGHWPTPHQDECFMAGK